MRKGIFVLFAALTACSETTAPPPPMVVSFDMFVVGWVPNDQINGVPVGPCDVRFQATATGGSAGDFAELIRMNWVSSWQGTTTPNVVLNPLQLLGSDRLVTGNSLDQTWRMDEDAPQGMQVQVELQYRLPSGERQSQTRAGICG